MSEFEMFLCCLLVPLFFVLVYVAGRLNLISWAVRAAADFSSASGKTNADRIRSMTDEELAEFLLDIWDREPWCAGFKAAFCDSCIWHDCGAGCVCPHGDEVSWWLQQPAKEVPDEKTNPDHHV